MKRGDRIIEFVSRNVQRLSTRDTKTYAVTKTSARSARNGNDPLTNAHNIDMCSGCLCHVLGQFGQPFAMTFGGSDDLHLLPVISELLATIQTDNIGSGQCSGLGAALGTANGYGKAVARVSATEQRIYQFFNHVPTFHTWACVPVLGFLLESDAPYTSVTLNLATHLLRFMHGQKGFRFSYMQHVGIRMAYLTEGKGFTPSYSGFTFKWPFSGPVTADKTSWKSGFLNKSAA